MSPQIINTITGYIYAGTSFPIRFDCQSSEENIPLNISSVKVYIKLADAAISSTDQYINGRDGTNNVNLQIVNSTVKFDMMPADNQLANDSDDPSYFETHSIIFEIFYNNDTDKFFEEFRINIIKPPVGLLEET